MKKRVNNYVNNVWLRKMRNLLTGNSQEVNRLYTELFAITNEHCQMLKRECHQEALKESLGRIIEGIKFGWIHGLNEGAQINRHRLFLQLSERVKDKRLRAVIITGAEAGHRIGKQQWEETRKRNHHIARE